MQTLRVHLEEKEEIKNYSWQKNEGLLVEGDSPILMYDCLHGHLPVDKRRELLKEFQEGKFNILICSGLAARGIDFQGINQVILYDFPKNPVDYLHRIGRTARANSTGKVTSFITGATCKVANSIRKFLSRNHRITGDCHEEKTNLRKQMHSKNTFSSRVDKKKRQIKQTFF